MNTEQIKYSVKNVIYRKTRSSLTVLSILIGIAAIFALVSFGLGIQNYIDVLADEAGADKLFIQARSFGAPGTDDSFFISREDIKFVEKIRGVNEISGIYMGIAEIRFKNNIKYAYVMGYDTKKEDFIFESFTTGILSGRSLNSGELDRVLLGYNYQMPDKIFKKPLELREKITINGHEFRVAGFIKEIGNPADDSNIYLTEEAFEMLYPSKKDKFGYVMVSSDKTTTPSDLAENIEERLRKRRGQKQGEEDFTVQTFEDLLEIFGTFIDIINGILILIAFISVIVASVNVMNTMYTSVLERTKEIGIMKAIGAKNSDIIFIFVFESGLLGLIGGALGILLGYLISTTGGNYAAIAGYSALYPVFPLSLILGCLIFSSLIGALSGILPAIQASKLKPVEALRYE
jgi:putative ABC transport system permease protein